MVNCAPLTDAAEADACTFKTIWTGAGPTYTAGIGEGVTTDTPLGNPGTVMFAAPRNPPPGVNVTVTGDEGPPAASDKDGTDGNSDSDPAGNGVGSTSKYAPVGLLPALVNPPAPVCG